MNKNIICYFSATGTTKNVAQKIADGLKSELFEIEPIQPYTSQDLDWENKHSRTSLEMADDKIKPNIKEKVRNIENYDNIILGFPVWWYKEPNIIDSFIEENKLENKKIYVFITSGGSTVNGSLESLKKKYSNINFVSGKRFDTEVNEQEVLEWIGELYD